MKIFSVKSSRKLPRFFLLSFIFSVCLWNCSLIPVRREIGDKWKIPAFRERCRQLKNMTNLAGSGQVNISSAMGDGMFFFDFEYKTADTLNVRIQDPLGRQFASLELCEETYHLNLIREGRYFTGTQIETARTPISIGTISPNIIRRILLGAPIWCEEFGDDLYLDQSGEKLSAIHYQFKPGQDEPTELNWWQDDRQILVIYKQYADIDGLRLPSQIVITDKSETFSIIIHFSHFNAVKLKFQS